MSKSTTQLLASLETARLALVRLARKMERFGRDDKAEELHGAAEALAQWHNSIQEGNI